MFSLAESREDQKRYLVKEIVVTPRNDLMKIRSLRKLRFVRAGMSHREVKDAGAHRWRARTQHILSRERLSLRSEQKERLRWRDLFGSENV